MAWHPAGPRRPHRIGRATGAILAVLVIVLGGLTFAWFHRPAVVLSPTCAARAGSYSAELEPDQARNAALIAGMAVKRGLAPRAATVALATAAQESKLRNIDYGDRDSLGLFQQRPSQGWGTKAQIMDPVYSANEFYNHLLRIPGYQQLPVTKAAQQVQHSGYPDAYAYHEGEARALAASIFGQYPAALSCQLSPPKAVPGASRRIAEAAAADLGLDPTERSASQLVYRFTNTAAGRQRAWGLAHWTVASADQFGVTSVHTAGRVWTRSDTELSWGDDSTAATKVVIDIAA